MQAVLERFARLDWLGLLIVAVVATLALAAFQPAFLSTFNIYVLLLSFSLWALVAMAQMVIIAIGQLNLSVGAIGGLVAITPASGFVDPVGALFIGIIAGAGCYWGATWLKKTCGYDDALDVFGIHGVGGIIGAILTGVFAVEAIGGTPGMLEGNAGQVLTQLWGIVATIVYCAVASAIILKVIDLIIGLRVDEETERDGLDLRLHGETVQ